MTDDIVARLRCITWMGDATLCAHAADEIERLRAELCEARQLIFRLQTNAACCRTSPDATTRDGEAPFELEQIMRGEYEEDGK